MTKSEIKAELRRSACEDTNPYDVEDEAFDKCLEFQSGAIVSLRPDSWRIFFLLVAEAL